MLKGMEFLGSVLGTGVNEIWIAEFDFFKITEISL